MKRNVLPGGLLVPLTVSACGQIPRPGSHRGGERAGAYVRPGLAGVARKALRSPRGAFAVEPFAGDNGLVAGQAGKESPRWVPFRPRLAGPSARMNAGW